MSNSEPDGMAAKSRNSVVRPVPVPSVSIAWVRNLEPNHSYLLQRAVDTQIDGNCTGTTWLTLGRGLTPQAIETDGTGTGRTTLFRDLAAIPSGSEFDIHFQVIDAITKAVVLSSACYTYTVR